MEQVGEHFLKNFDTLIYEDNSYAYFKDIHTFFKVPNLIFPLNGSITPFACISFNGTSDIKPCALFDLSFFFLLIIFLG